MSDDQSSEVKTKHVTAGKVFSWIFAVLFGISGISNLIVGKITIGLLLILATVAILPPMNAWVEKRFHFVFSGMLKVIIVVVLLTMIGSLAYSSQSSSLNTAAQTSGATANNTEAAAPAQAPIKVSAAQLMEDYNNNEVSADEKYKGNTVEITGVIDSIGKDILGNPYVTLQTGTYSAFEVQCMFSQSDESVLAKLSSGRSITLEGIVAGKPINVEVDGCSVVQ